METKNPYLEPLHEKIRQMSVGSSPRLQQEHDELRAQADAWTRRKVDEMTQRVETVRETMLEKEQIMLKKQGNLRKEYQALIDLYRQAMTLAKEISAIKKQIREGR